MSQTTNEVLMIQPAHFAANPQTAVDNKFQIEEPREIEVQVEVEALKEFNVFRSALEDAGIKVVTYVDYRDLNTPDSIFPNNWFSTHANSTLVLYPMKAENRRRERRPDIVNDLRLRYENVVDLTRYENEGKFLEGTGSLALDRVNKIAYACLSQRTDHKLLREWSTLLGYSICEFSACDKNGAPIYHTNVMMAVLSKLAIVSLECIGDRDERNKLVESLANTGHEIVEISFDQVIHFCGNLLELASPTGPILALSKRAHDWFTVEQRQTIERHLKFVSAPIDAIETYGGGGARCMLAELF